MLAQTPGAEGEGQAQTGYITGIIGMSVAAIPIVAIILITLFQLVVMVIVLIETSSG